MTFKADEKLLLSQNKKTVPTSFFLLIFGLLTHFFYNKRPITNIQIHQTS